MDANPAQVPQWFFEFPDHEFHHSSSHLVKSGLLAGFHLGFCCISQAVNNIMTIGTYEGKILIFFMKSTYQITDQT